MTSRCLTGSLRFDNDSVQLRSRCAPQRDFEQCRPEPGPVAFMAHARHDLALYTSTGGGADKTLRNHRWHDAVVGTAEMQLRDQGHLGCNIDRIERLRH